MYYKKFSKVAARLANENHLVDTAKKTFEYPDNPLWTVNAVQSTRL